MKTTLLRTVYAGLTLIVIGTWVSSYHAVEGGSRALAAEWDEGILNQVSDPRGGGVDAETGELATTARLQLLIDGETFSFDPGGSVKDASGKRIPFGQLVPQSRVRFRAEHGVITDIVLVEVLPR